MQPRGGVLQRLRAVEGADVAETPRSVLADRLLEQWAWGLISTPQVQLLAAGALLDGAVRAELSTLAGLGGGGVWPGNTRRDLVHGFLRGLSMPLPAKVEIPVQDKNGDLDFAEVPVLLPSDVCRFLYHEYRDHFDSLTGGLAQFWDQVRQDDPKLVNHPMLTKHRWRERAIPLVFHGDSVQFVKDPTNSLFVLHFSFLLASGNTWDTHFLTFSLPKGARATEDAQGANSMDLVWRLLVADFHDLFIGAKNGNPIFDGEMFAVIWIVCGDLEFLSNELRMPHFNSNNPCWLCQANRSDNNIRDVSRGARWKATVHIDQSAPSEHPIWQAPGLHRHHCPGDAMHISDCRGVSAHLLGSALWQLVLECPRHIQGTVDERVLLLWEEIQRIYGEQRVENRIFKLSRDMINTGPQNWAVLSSTVKAAATRALVPVVRQLCTELCSGTMVSVQRVLALEAMETYYTVMERNGFVLPPSESAQLLEAVERLLLHYNYLTQQALSQGHLLYNLVVKHHFLWHVADQSKWLNPRSSWAYSYENFIGKIGTCARSLVFSTPPHLVPTKLVENYRLALCLRLRRAHGR